jgi:hypothetical protein
LRPRARLFDSRANRRYDLITPSFFSGRFSLGSSKKMPDDKFAYKEVPTGLPAETALDIASTLTNFVPWIGGAVSNVLGGLSVGRKLNRVNEVLEGLANDLRGFKSEVSERYVKTEEFEELLENVLRKAAEERNEQKRRLLGTFLVEAIKHPVPSYDEQKSILRLLDDVEPAHMLILRALAESPRPEEINGMLLGSIVGTLQRRLSDLSGRQIEDLVTRMNDLRIITLTSNRMHTTMTAAGAADLRSTISPIGQRLMSFIKA